MGLPRLQQQLQEEQLSTAAPTTAETQHPFSQTSPRRHALPSPLQPSSCPGEPGPSSLNRYTAARSAEEGTGSG